MPEILSNKKIIKYKTITKYFPETEDEQFNKWNEHGYNSISSMCRGYEAYLIWLKKLDNATYKEMERDNVI